MASNSIILLFLLVAGVAAVSARLPDDGWQHDDYVADPHVVEVAKFAISTYNEKSGSKLVFARVESGKRQFGSGVTYKLILAVRNPVVEQYYSVVVEENVNSGKLELGSFESVYIVD